MAGIISKNMRFWVVVAGVALGASLCAPAHAQKPKVIKAPPAKKAPADDTAQSAEPDKVLYQRAMADVKKGRFTEGRLALQTLINTYPDSEYLAKAKLAVADSYYQEGGTSNLTQAIGEYKNFIVFFPFLDEAAYAQMQVGMAHYKMMEKSDRDNEQAEDAEDEFQAFLLKFPQSPLVPQAEQRLREVQEVLADGEYKIAHYYYMKPDYRAAAARLLEVTDRYPLYSQSDEALWMLGDIYQRAKNASKNEDDKNHWADLAAKCYDRILQNYPLSPHAGDAKARLTAMSMAVPPADPGALARMTKNQQYARTHHQSVLSLKTPLTLVSSRPDLTLAAHSGDPNLNPPTDTISATDVLKSGAQGPTFGVKPAADPSAAPDASDAPTTQFETSPDSGAPITGSDSGATVGATIIEAPTSDSTAQGTAEPPANNSNAPGVQTLTPEVITPTPAGSDGAGTSAPAGNPPAADAPNGNAPAQGAAPAADGSNASSPAPQTSSTSGAVAPGSATAPADDPKDESTSKKKKGLRKLVPW
ncbi:MAG: outer membrane protein assembly factor BamD [Candidatus Acidiferrales bacterium]